jgi:hypothetical protein
MNATSLFFNIFSFCKKEMLADKFAKLILGLTYHWDKPGPDQIPRVKKKRAIFSNYLHVELEKKGITLIIDPYISLEWGKGL